VGDGGGGRGKGRGGKQIFPQGHGALGNGFFYLNFFFYHLSPEKQTKNLWKGGGGSQAQLKQQKKKINLVTNKDM